MLRTTNTNTGDQYSISINLALAAKRLVDFMQKKENWPLLIDAIKRSKSSYKDYSILLGIVYWFTRVREPEIDKVISSLNSSISEKTSHNSIALRLIYDLVNKGGMIETSFNKHVLYEFLALIPEYKETDKNPQESVTFDNLVLFRKQFSKEAKRILDAVKAINLDDVKSLQVARMEEQSVLTKSVNVKAFWNNVSAQKALMQRPAGPVQRGNSLGDKFKGIKDILSGKKPELIKATKPELSTTMKLAATLLASRMKGQEKRAEEVNQAEEPVQPLQIEPAQLEQAVQLESGSLENNTVVADVPPPPPPPPAVLRK